mgnify:CR=1 FL=1
MSWKDILKMSPIPEVVRVDGEYYALNFDKPITQDGFYSYLPLVKNGKLVDDKEDFLNQSPRRDLPLDIEEADLYATIRNANQDKELKELYFKLKNQ